MRWPCCGNVFIRSSPDTKTPTTPTVCATIRCCRSSPIRNWARLWARNLRSAAGRTRPRAAIWCASTTLGASSSSVSAAIKSASAARFCSTSTPPPIPPTGAFQQRAEPRQKQLKRRYRRTQLPQRSFSSFRHRARSWPRLRRICYKAEHSAAGTNLRFVVTNCPGPAAQVFAFYNDRGECENRIDEFKNGFRADPLSCHRFLANAFLLLLHAYASHLVHFV